MILSGVCQHSVCSVSLPQPAIESPKAEASRNDIRFACCLSPIDCLRLKLAVSFCLML
jgi:hypothetical protein